MKWRKFFFLILSLFQTLTVYEGNWHELLEERPS
jgi:hypothetical protein